MILYLGTSSLIKLYVAEQHSEAIRKWVNMAEIVATCRIAYTEMMAALDIRTRKGDITAHNYEYISRRFSLDWQRIARLDFDDREAGSLVKKYSLTRFGALHLSAAKLITSDHARHRALFETVHRGPLDIQILFSSADERLCAAAEAENLMVLDLRPARLPAPGS